MRLAYEGQVEKIMGSRMTIEQQVMAIENANVNLETMNAMRSGADAMKAIHGNLLIISLINFRNIDKVDETMDDIREQMDLANEISEAISQPVNFGVEFDEDELTLELEALEQEEVDAISLDVGLQGLPRVPTDIPGNLLLNVSAIAQPPRPNKEKKVKDDVDDELAELQASMAMN